MRTVRLVAVCLILVAAIISATTTIFFPWLSDKSGADHPPDGWEEIASAKWGFTVLMPAPVGNETKTIVTPYGDAPLVSFASSIGTSRFTVAMAEYDPRVTHEFTEEERYESAGKVASEVLGGNLVHNDPFQHAGIVGRDQLIEVPGEARLHTQVFLVGKRSYQIQVVTLANAALNPALERRFLDSLTIMYRPEE